MAYELYLALNREIGSSSMIKGEAQAADYEDQIEVLTWEWNVALKTVVSDTAEDDSDRSDPKSVKLKKRLDRSSTVLMNGGAELTKFPKAVLTLVDRELKGRSEPGVQPKLKLTVTLTGVRVLSYELTMNDAETEVTLDEILEFDFETMSIEYAGHANAKNEIPTGKCEFKRL
jgi:type VI protein secretion system component Hcp